MCHFDIKYTENFRGTEGIIKNIQLVNFTNSCTQRKRLNSNEQLQGVLHRQQSRDGREKQKRQHCRGIQEGPSDPPGSSLLVEYSSPASDVLQSVRQASL